MREIKFRAWDKERKVMFTPAVSFEEIDGEGILQKFHPQGAFTFNVLMQFTGLKDKDGVDIYEGDIVKVSQRSEVKDARYREVGEVVWIDHVAAFGVEIKTGDEGLESVTFDFGAFYHDDPEVIGDIYQHPELLSQRSQPK